MPRLLIVDDDDDIRKWLSLILSDKGYEVTEIDRPDTVVRQMLTGDIDLALIDYRMPGQDGLSLLRSIRSMNINTPVVILTGDSSQAVAVECFRIGAADFIAKPIDPDYLQIVVNRALDRFSATLKNMAYRALGYVKHKQDCAFHNDAQACSCGLKEIISNIQDF